MAVQSTLSFAAAKPSNKRPPPADGKSTEASRKVVSHLVVELQALLAPAGISQQENARGEPFHAEASALIKNAHLALSALAASLRPPLKRKRFGEVVTNDYIFSVVWPLVLSLHNSQPGHPMFGEPAIGKIRLPLELPGGRGALASWRSKVENLGALVRKRMGPTIIPGSCWLAPDEDTCIQPRPPSGLDGVRGKVVRLRTWKTYRWLAFLKDPSAENWRVLDEKDSSVHFLHNCHQGFSREADGGCVNGVQHGVFGSPLINNHQKDCRDGHRGSCPGHGTPLSYCFFVFEDGEPRPCYNLPEGPPEACPHVRPCFE
jgi:hypothetical protein